MTKHTVEDFTRASWAEVKRRTRPPGISGQTVPSMEQDAERDGYRRGFMDAAEWARTRLAGQFEKVEQERDRLATVLATTARQRDDADKRSARPLKPTDAMVARARESLRSDGWTVGEDDTGLRAALAAALTEPPARPEGAEDIEMLIADQMGGDIDPTAMRELADHLAGSGVRFARQDKEKR